MATEKTDVVIVGVGAAGGILAAELGKAGMKVIGLERGPRLKTADFSPHEELRSFQRQELRPTPKRMPVTWRPNTSVRANPLPILNYGNQAGGGTVHYGTLSWRFHEDDFRARSHTIERYGASSIPADSSLADWPMTYADLEPFYDRAEYELGVSGKAGNLQGRATGVSYFGPDGSDNTIEAEIVILTPFIYDNTRLLLLSKSEKFPNGLANSSGQVGKHLMAHIGPRVFATFDDRFVNIYMGPSAQKHSLDDFNADNFDHGGLAFIRGGQVSVSPVDLEAGPIGAAMSMNPPPGTPRWGAAYRDFLAKYFTRHAAIVAQTENLPYADQTIDLDPGVRDQWGLPAPRLTYDWRRPNEVARVEFLLQKLEGVGHAMGAPHVWRAPLGPGIPGAHHEGGTRMGNDPKTSVVNRYGQSWDIPNLFVIGSSTFPSMSGFNPTLTIQAVTYMSADAIVNRYKRNPGPLA